MNITVTLSIWPTSYFIDPEGVVIDNSQYLLVVGPNKTAVPTGWFDQLMEFHLISNSSRFGLQYSTTWVPNSAFPSFAIGNTVSLNNAGWLTGTVYMYVGSKGTTKPGWFEALAIRNMTTISLGSYQDLQLEKQTNLLENLNLQNNAQIQYADNETGYNNEVVTSLTWVIIGFVVIDVGFTIIDIGVSLYDVSEKKNR